jgi:hypothetical protein
VTLAEAFHSTQIHQNAYVPKKGRDGVVEFFNQFIHYEYSRIPFKIGNEMIIILRANFDDFRKKLVTVLRSFCSIHVHHQFLDNFHEVLL